MEASSASGKPNHRYDSDSYNLLHIWFCVSTAVCPMYALATDNCWMCLHTINPVEQVLFLSVALHIVVLVYFVPPGRM